MGIVEEYQDWTDSAGLIHPFFKPGRGASQNGIRWTSEAYIVFAQHGLMSDALREKFFQAIKTCEVPGCVGLYDRTDTRRGEQEGPDDYHALIGACAVLGLRHLAKEVLDYGRNQNFRLRDLDLSQIDSSSIGYKVLCAIKACFGFVRLKYNYNNNSPGQINTASWMGRFPALIAGMKWAAGERPSLFEKGYLALAILFSSRQPRSDQDQWALTWLLMHAAKEKSLIVDLAIRYWYRRLRQVAPGGMSQILSEFFQNTQYPTVKYIQD